MSPWGTFSAQGIGVAHGVLEGSTAKGRGLGTVQTKTPPGEKNSP